MKDEKGKRIYYVCPKCKNTETEYDYDKINDTFIIKCKKCKTVISTQQLKNNYQKEKRFDLDKRTKFILLGLFIAVILGLLIGETVANIYQYYQDASMKAIMAL